MPFPLALWLAPFLLLCSSIAEAGLTIYRSPTAYFAEVGVPREVQTFDGSPPGGAEVAGHFGSLHFDSCGKPGPDICNGEVLWTQDAITHAPSYSGTMFNIFGGHIDTSNTDSPYDSAIAFELFGDTSQTKLYLSMGGLAGDPAYIQSFALNGATGFFGVVSDLGFETFQLVTSDDLEGRHRVYLDTMWLAPVPEPSTAALIGAGWVLAVGAAARRSRRHRVGDHG
ncbi:PEP-CTERM sorting domain-containing protein [Caldimonas brevitalea]|uniref:Ice-binding protein C-terminal domain-containing protein n=1 Tax=Caldimonas brevitalea TaxID=413882 RepID=A0A0G3BV66_9BURK|nr:PEP-CTERM sorting domain-containing protein [Caldimonas brevitalea]AKJ31923.1 hypothetical protein AAW51_5232 [Caldimonas brevitalea]